MFRWIKCISAKYIGSSEAHRVSAVWAALTGAKGNKTRRAIGRMATDLIALVFSAAKNGRVCL